jgi:hypothetical protein
VRYDDIRYLWDRAYLALSRKFGQLLVDLQDGREKDGPRGSLLGNVGSKEE